MTRADLIRAAAVSRDLLMVAVGCLLISDIPPSVDEFSPSQWVARVWATALIAGGIVSAYGVIRRRVAAETVGCLTVGGGFLIWSIAALSQPQVTATSMAVGLVFLAGAVGQVFRAVAAPYVAAAASLLAERQED